MHDAGATPGTARTKKCAGPPGGDSIPRDETRRLRTGGNGEQGLKSFGFRVESSWFGRLKEINIMDKKLVFSEMETQIRNRRSLSGKIRVMNCNKSEVF